MKTLFLMMAVVGLVLPLVGCETLTDTPTENAVRLKHAAYQNLSGINNDWQKMLLVDRPTWLTNYPSPND
jgi:hypothetical protein